LNNDNKIDTKNIEANFLNFLVQSEKFLALCHTIRYVQSQYGQFEKTSN